MRVHWKQLAAFAFLGLVAVWALLDYQPLALTAVERIEIRQRVNTCVDEAPRACQRLLNALLRSASPNQRKRIRWASRENARVLEHPKVRSPRRVEQHTPPPKARAEPGEPPPPEKPSESPPSPEPPTATVEPPTPRVAEPPPQPSPDPALPPTVTVPEPPQICEPLPELPVCPTP